MSDKYIFISLFILVALLLMKVKEGKFSNYSSTEISKRSIEKSTESTGSRLFQKIKVGDKKLKVEVVQSPLGLKNGLSNRDSIGSDGMLFILPSEQKISFWMKDMRFALDMIWIKDGRVIEIIKDVPYPNSSNNSDLKLILYSPKKNVGQVLEVNAGDSEKFGILVGDKISFIK